MKFVTAATEFPLPWLFLLALHQAWRVAGFGTGALHDSTSEAPTPAPTHGPPCADGIPGWKYWSHSDADDEILVFCDESGYDRPTARFFLYMFVVR